MTVYNSVSSKAQARLGNELGGDDLRHRHDIIIDWIVSFWSSVPSEKKLSPGYNALVGQSTVDSLSMLAETKRASKYDAPPPGP